MNNARLFLPLLLVAGPAISLHARFDGYLNHGLVAVGRVPADATDARGPGLDTLGGFGSAAFFDPATWSKNGDTYSGVLYALPDRGFGDGTRNYLPRIQVFDLSITPYNLPQATAQFLAPAMTEALSSHYMGDEGSRLVSPQSQGIIAFLQGQGDAMSQLFVNTLRGLFNDPTPADNNVTLHLMTGTTTP